MALIFEDVNRPEVLAREKWTRRIIVGVAFALLLAGFLYWQLKNFREERTARNFMAALQHEDFRAAYQIWRPPPSYSFEDFLRDWGPKGEFGKIQEFYMVRSRSRGSGVIVTMQVNGREARLWVARSDKSISFPPY